MTGDAGAGPGAVDLLDALRSAEVTHLVGLPDSISAALVDRALAEGRPAFVPVTREGEAFAVASGLWLGGATPAVVVQNTGLLESGDALRGTAARMGVPLLVLVTWRGYARMGPGRAAGSGPDPASETGRVDPAVDTAAVLTEPTLRAWGIPYGVYGEVGRGPALDALVARARAGRRPVALLLPHRLRGPC